MNINIDGCIFSNYREFFMETTQKSVYLVHKMDISVDCDDLTDSQDDASLDHRKKSHYFDKVLPNKYSLKKQFKQLSKPNELQHGIVSIRTNNFKINTCIC